MDTAVLFELVRLVEDGYGRQGGRAAAHNGLDGLGGLPSTGTSEASRNHTRRNQVGPRGRPRSRRDSPSGTRYLSASGEVSLTVRRQFLHEEDRASGSREAKRLLTYAPAARWARSLPICERHPREGASEVDIDPRRADARSHSRHRLRHTPPLHGCANRPENWNRLSGQQFI
jgi:hypothetical protein